MKRSALLITYLALFLLGAASCQGATDDTSQSCTGLSEATLSYLVNGEDYSATEQGEFPYRRESSDVSWRCSVTVDDEEVFRLSAGKGDNLYVSEPDTDPGHFIYRGGAGEIGEREGWWTCGDVVIYPRSIGGTVSEAQMAAVLIDVAQETGCRMEPEQS